MNKLVWTAALAAVFTYTSLDAAVYKGQREYKKKCKECHKDGLKFAAQYKKRDWKKMFAKKGIKVQDLHLASEDAKSSHKYFKKKFKKKAKHLRDFFKEYAKDSGNVPACD
jgi:mono/diheme cytochrome c family protein